MIVFLVPLKSAKISKSWKATSETFERTARSICNQDCDKFRLVVICHEKPDTSFESPFLDYIQVDFLPPENDCKDYAPLRKDKAKKLLIGAEYSKKSNPSHLMVVDADDFVSNKIASFVDKNVDQAGYIFDNGYVYESGSRFFYYLRRHFANHCGTSIIIKPNLFELLFDDGIYEHRGFTLDGFDLNLPKLPFVGSIYNRGHGENIFANRNLGRQFYRDGDFVGYLKHLSRFRPITLRMKKEFSF
ncbi:MAG: glycosyltransferase family 2 protein [Pseudanabaena sp.]|nr:MAG: glycosyltransferase family 2 protein [Pseudanabaena sp.]